MSNATMSEAQARHKRFVAMSEAKRVLSSLDNELGDTVPLELDNAWCAAYSQWAENLQRMIEDAERLVEAAAMDGGKQ